MPWHQVKCHDIGFCSWCWLHMLTSADVCWRGHYCSGQLWYAFLTIRGAAFVTALCSWLRDCKNRPWSSGNHIYTVLCSWHVIAKIGLGPQENNITPRLRYSLSDAHKFMGFLRNPTALWAVFESFITPILICKSCLQLSFSWFIINLNFVSVRPTTYSVSDSIVPFTLGSPHTHTVHYYPHTTYTPPPSPHPHSPRSRALRSFGFFRVWPGLVTPVWPLDPLLGLPIFLPV